MVKFNKSLTFHYIISKISKNDVFIELFIYIINNRHRDDDGVRRGGDHDGGARNHHDGDGDHHGVHVHGHTHVAVPVGGQRRYGMPSIVEQHKMPE